MVCRQRAQPPDRGSAPTPTPATRWEERVLRRHGRKPHGSIGVSAGVSRPATSAHADRRRRRHAEQRSPRAARVDRGPRSPTPIEIGEPQPGRDVDDSGGGDQHDRQPRPAAQQRGDRQQPERERQHPRVEVRLEGVGAGPGDAVAQREGAPRAPRSPTECWNSTRADQQSASQMSAQSTAGTRRGRTPRARAPVMPRRAPRGPRRTTISRPWASMSAASRGKAAGFERADDDGNVERLVGAAVAIAGAVGRGERARTGRPPRGPRRRRPALLVHIWPSSALGRRSTGRGTSCSRRYTLSCPR